MDAADLDQRPREDQAKEAGQPWPRDRKKTEVWTPQLWTLDNIRPTLGRVINIGFDGSTEPIDTWSGRLDVDELKGMSEQLDRSWTRGWTQTLTPDSLLAVTAKSSWFDGPVISSENSQNTRSPISSGYETDPNLSRSCDAKPDQPQPTVMTRNLTAGRIDQDAAGLSLPEYSKIWSLTTDPEQNRVYAAVRDIHAVLVFSTSGGQIVLEAKFAPLTQSHYHLFRPTGVHFCRVSKLLYVTDNDNHNILGFNRDGELVWSLDAKGQLEYPCSVAVWPCGGLMAVLDTDNYRLQVFDMEGCLFKRFDLWNITKDMDYPRGLCFDQTGSTVFLSDLNDHYVFAFRKKKPEPLCLLDKLIQPPGLPSNLTGNVLICDSRTFHAPHEDPTLRRPSGMVATTSKGLLQMKTGSPPPCPNCGGFLVVVDCDGTRLQIIF